MKTQEIDYNFNDLYYRDILVPQLNMIRQLKIYGRNYTQVLGELVEIYITLHNTIEKHDKEKLELLTENIKDAKKKLFKYEMTGVKRGPRKYRAKQLSKSKWEVKDSIDILQRNLLATIDSMGMMFKRTQKGNPNTAVMNR